MSRDFGAIGCRPLNWKKRDPITVRTFERFFTDKATPQDCQDLLLVLSRTLYEHYGQRVVIWIDDSNIVLRYVDQCQDAFGNCFCSRGT